MPNFMRHVNKCVFNRWELARGTRPVLHHTGRVSSKAYRTPLEPRAVDGGYTFLLMYGADKSDWVKNVPVAGNATLVADGVEHELTNPRLFSGEEGLHQVPNNDNRPSDMLKITQILRMDTVPPGETKPGVRKCKI